MLFVFDWDGTLCDSTDKIIGCMHRAADTLRLPSLPDDDVRNIIGLGLPEAIQVLYPELDGRGVAAMRGAYAEHFVAADHQPSELFPNVLETLDKLLLQGHHIAVATGKSRAGLDRVLSSMSLSGLFHGSRCADETASKPDPRMLHELLAEFGLTADKAIMVGDTEFDMEMARRANMPRIAVDYGAHHVSRLEPYDPLSCVSDIAAILQWSAS